MTIMKIAMTATKAKTMVKQKESHTHVVMHRVGPGTICSMHSFGMHGGYM